MNRLTRAGLLVLVLPVLYAAIFALFPSPGAAALLEMRPGAIDHPLHLAGADFNLDGYDDLVIANFQAGTVTVLINQKDGTFAPQKDSPNIVGAATVNQPSLGPLYLAVGDLNPEDVDGDRVDNNVDNCPNAYNPVSGSAQIDTDNNGVGDACQTTTPTLDTDLDGIPDYVNGVLDNCPHTPNPGQELETAAGADGICNNADDNVFLFGPNRTCGDGDDLTSKVGVACSRNADLIVLNSTTGGSSTLGLVRVRVNDGDGGLRARFSLQASSGASQAALGDLNGDRRPDLVVSNAGTDALLLFPGAEDGDMGAVCLGGSNAGRSCVSGSACPGGTCKSTEILLTAGTCSGGTTPGVACARNGNCQGGGTCRATGATCALGSSPGKTCTLDADCPGGGTCQSPARPEGVVIADFDDDMQLDLAFANRTTGNVGILMNAGAGAFSPAPGFPFATAQQPVALLAGSLDGDACADLVVLEQGPLVCQGGTTAGDPCKADADCAGGGVCRADHGMIQTFLGDCQGSISPAQSIDLGAGHVPRGGALIDFDRDGVLDLAVADFTASQVAVYRGLGSGNFVQDVTLTGLANPSALATLNYDPDTGPNIDLAVLNYATNRVDLYRNTSTPGSLSFAIAPTSPVSPWKGITAMAMFSADASIGDDVVLLNASPPRLDILSGSGTTFRGLPPEPLSGPTIASAMTPANLRQDSLLDLLVLDGGASGTATPVISELTGVQTERPPVPAGNGPVQAAVAPLTLHDADYDQDGVLNVVLYDTNGKPIAFDNCPTRYNPPNCPANDKINFPQCYVEVPCTDASKAPLDCLTKDPITSQCDSDGNGVGDQCQILGSACQPVDTDLDLEPDYSPSTTAPRIDNCPWIANSNQEDADDDRIGDACDGSICESAVGSGTCQGGPKLNSFCQIDADCDAPVNDAVVVDGAGGSLSFLIGDASGSFRVAPFSPVGGLDNPVGAAVGRFTYSCIGGVAGFPLTCTSNPAPAILVAEKGAAGSGDDALRLLEGVPGGFAPPAPPVAAQVALQGDPSLLLIAPDQPVCQNPWSAINDLRYHFDSDGRTSVLAAIEPGTSSVQVLLPGNEGPAPPPAQPDPIAVPSPPSDAVFVDLNRDGYLDLVVLSPGDGNPSTPNVTIYIGIGTGLFFTDPSINPTDVPDGMTLLAPGNINLAVDSTYPDMVVFDSLSQTPVIMTNMLPERADIDRSGRVDGYDLALLARAFGAVRGEDFTLGADATLLQNPDLSASPAYSPTRLVVGSGPPLRDGMDLPALTGTVGLFICDHALQPLTGLYGIPVDINLDGKIDGEDLALLASRFGASF